MLSQGGVLKNKYARSFIEANKSLPYYLDHYIYLQYSAVTQQEFIDQYHERHDLEIYYHEFRDRNLIYNNSGSEIWK